MANKIRFRRGTKAVLPALAVGEPGFCTDTKELFVGAAGGNVQFPTKEYTDGQYAYKTPQVVPLTPLNGFTMSGNSVCMLTYCGAAKTIHAELKFSANIGYGTTIFYTGITGVHTPIICSVFDYTNGEFLGQVVAWIYLDGRVALFSFLGYNPSKGDYNILQIHTTIGGWS